MKLTAKLAKSQLKINRRRTVWTLIGIVLSAAMITAVFGFAASGDAMLREFIGDNYFYDEIHTTIIAGMSTVFVSIIMAASIIVVSNAFHVSAGQRTAQFGILKSVGATKRQIIGIIMREGVYLCIIGIPIGLSLGLLVNFTGVQVVNYLLVTINAINPYNPMTPGFVFAWQAILLSIVLSFLTVMVSAWLPARKAAKIAAIDAIRGAGEVKVESKKFRGGKLIGMVFGLEGTLAAKSLKRSRRSFRATVISLTISVALFIAAGSFGVIMNTVIDAFFPGLDVTAFAQFHTSHHVTWGDDNEPIERRYVALNSELASEITDKMREFPDTQVFGVGIDIHTFMAEFAQDMFTPRMYEAFILGTVSDDSYANISVSFMAVDAENYALLCALAGVPLGSNILINQVTHFQPGGRTIFAPFEFDTQTIRVTSIFDDREFYLPLHGVLNIGEIPAEISSAAVGVSIIVPQLDALTYAWYVNSADPEGFTEYALEVLRDMFVFDESLGNVSAFNVQAEMDAMQDVGRIVMIFVYGFISMLTLIGLTNVISTVSTNIYARSREFAMLKSVGMDRRGLRRTLNLESILCSAKAVVIGLPIGIFASWLIHGSVADAVAFPFEVPWATVAQCVIGVFVITWAVTMVSARKLRGQNVVEALQITG